MTQLEWHIEQRKSSELIPLSYNPSVMDAPKKAKLQASLQKFNLVEIPVINLDGVLIAGHKRVAMLIVLGRGDELIDVRVPNRLLTEDELKEYNIISNALRGDWVEDLLKEHFVGVVDLEAAGLDNDVLDRIMNDEESLIAEAGDEEKPVYPIVPRFSEKHGCIVIVYDNQVDENFLHQVLGIEKSQSYKNDNVGSAAVITAEKFARLWTSSKS